MEPFSPQLMFDKLNAISDIVNEAIAAGNNSSYIDRIYEVINEAPVND